MTSLNLFAEADKLLLKMVQKVGLLSNMSAYQMFFIGVDDFPMMIKTILWLQSKGSLKTENQQFGQWLRASQFNPLKKMVIDVKGYGEDWRVRPEPVQFEEQRAPALPSNLMILQDDSIGSTQVTLHDDDAGSRRNREQLLVVEPTVDALSGGCQRMVIPDTCGLSNFEKSVPNFEETLQ